MKKYVVSNTNQETEGLTTSVVSEEKLIELYEDTHNVTLLEIPGEAISAMPNERQQKLELLAKQIDQLGVPTDIVELLLEEARYAEPARVLVSEDNAEAIVIETESLAEPLRGRPKPEEDSSSKFGDGFMRALSGAKAALTKDVKLSEVKIKM